jgi:hypothetical protein
MLHTSIFSGILMSVSERETFFIASIIFLVLFKGELSTGSHLPSSTFSGEDPPSGQIGLVRKHILQVQEDESGKQSSEDSSISSEEKNC